MMRMVDLSSFNPMISDWNAYKNWSKNGGNTSGIIIRATEGTAFVDSTFQERAKEALANGIDEIWYYCYSHPEYNTVQEEVDYLWQAVMNVVRQDRDTLMLDFEQNVQQAMPSYALAWLNLASYKVRKLPVFYSYLNFIETRNFKDYPIIAKYPLGLAAYTGSMPGVPAPWTEALWWQNADNGIVPGISAPVDTDIQESKENDSVVPDGPFYTVTAGKNGVPAVGNQVANALGITWQDLIAIPGNEHLQPYDPTGPYLIGQNGDGNPNYGVSFLVPGWQPTPVQTIDTAGIKTLLNEAISKLG